MAPPLGRLLIAGPSVGPQATVVWLARLAAAAVFAIFGVAKFTDHAAEVASFESYGLPAPDAFVYAIGVLEIGGAVLLAVGLLTRLAALMLAGDMIAALIIAGIGEGELISLTIAPALLMVMLFVLKAGPGSHALDHRLAAARRMPEA